MQFELINPSDKILFEAESMFIAGLVCALQGGQVSARNVGTEKSTPFFMFGGFDEYVSEHGEHLDTVIKNNAQKIIPALRSFKIAHGERTSMTDFCGWAHRLADRLEKAQEVQP